MCETGLESESGWEQRGTSQSPGDVCWRLGDSFPSSLYSSKLLMFSAIKNTKKNRLLNPHSKPAACASCRAGAQGSASSLALHWSFRATVWSRDGKLLPWACVFFPQHPAAPGPMCWLAASKPSWCLLCRGPSSLIRAALTWCSSVVSNHHCSWTGSCSSYYDCKIPFSNSR